MGARALEIKEGTCGNACQANMVSVLTVFSRRRHDDGCDDGRQTAPSSIRQLALPPNRITFGADKLHLQKKTGKPREALGWLPISVPKYLLASKYVSTFMWITSC